MTNKPSLVYPWLSLYLHVEPTLLIQVFAEHGNISDVLEDKTASNTDLDGPVAGLPPAAVGVCFLYSKTGILKLFCLQYCTHIMSMNLR